MPSKRDLIGNGPPSDGLTWAAFQWDRIGAFVIGVAALASYVLLHSLLESNQIPIWAIEMLAAIPLGLLWYGFTRNSWGDILQATIGAVMGGLLAIYVL